MEVGIRPTSEQSSETVKKLLKEFPNIEFIDEKNTTRTNFVQCKLYIKNDRPIQMLTRPLGFHKKKWIKKELDELLKAKVIRPSKSLYAAVLIIVKKKDRSF